MARKVRKQLYIDRKHDERLKALARETGRSEADIVREAMEQYRVGASKAAPLDHGAWLEALAFMRSLSGRLTSGKRERPTREQLYEEALASRGKRSR